LRSRKLTDAAVRRLKAKPGERIERFDTLPGFGIRVSGGPENGPQLSADQCTKSFFCFYRVHGRLRRLTLGRYDSENYPLAKARRGRGRDLGRKKWGGPGGKAQGSARS
jgi:hypothetical protein